VTGVSGLYAMAMFKWAERNAVKVR
jgi:hypothetical protein